MAENKNDLGEKTKEFSLVYQVDDSDNDELVVYEKLNGNIFNTVENPEYNTDLYCTITDEMLLNLPIQSKHTITIEVSDGDVTTTEEYTFTNPTINLREKSDGFDITYKIGEEFNNPTITEYMNGEVIGIIENAQANVNNLILISYRTLSELRNGVNSITIEVSDGTTTVTKTYNFIKISGINNIRFNNITPSRFYINGYEIEALYFNNYTMYKK